MKVKRILATIGAGLAAASILAACSNSPDKEEETNVSEVSQETKENAVVEPVSEEATQTEETAETTEETEEAVADVYGDGVSPVEANSGENGLSFLRDQLKEQGAISGFAYLGSVKEGENAKDVIASSDTAKSFKFIGDIDAEKIISDGGDDIFIFVPTDENSRVTVNTFAESDNGRVIYESDKGTPIVLRTKDELNDSMEIIITDSAGNVGHFSPEITSGSIVDLIFKDFQAYNFTVGNVDGTSVDRQFLTDTVVYREPELTVLMNEGLRISNDSFRKIYIDDMEFFTIDFGRQNGSDFIKERYYAVSKDGTLVYRYNSQINDWADLLAYDWNSEQYR